MLPAFHGEKMEKLTDLVAEVTEREVESWPRDDADRAPSPAPGADARDHPARRVRPRPGPASRGDPRPASPRSSSIGSKPLGLIPQLQRAPFGFGPWGRFDELSAETDALIYELIEERRTAAEDRDDVLSMLLEARHEDGSPMSDIELRDELMTLLVAGHETTASALAWAFERIARTPRVAERLAEEAGSGRRRLRHGHDPGDAAAPAGAAERRAAPRSQADHARRLGLPGGDLARGERVPRPPRSRDLSRAVRLPPRALPRRPHRAPTPGSRSAAAGAAASARASRSSR